MLRNEDVKPHQIALIGPRAWRDGSLSDLQEIDGAPLVTAAEKWRRGEGILVTTAKSFKGLEADIVQVCDDLCTLAAFTMTRGAGVGMGTGSAKGSGQ